MVNAREYPRPKNWQDFESLCCDLWRAVWSDPDTRKNGRERQPQHGVDVYGLPPEGDGWVGVQCKKRGGVRGRLARESLESEVAKARAFNPQLSRFILATTAPRDEAIQQVARELTDAQRAAGSFAVSIAAWDDIEELLDGHPEVVAKHFPAFAGSGLEAARVHYLRAVWSRLAPLPLTAIGLGGSHRDELPLAAVYTALDVNEKVQVTGPHEVDDARVLFHGVGGDLGEQVYFENLVARARQEAKVASETPGRTASAGSPKIYSRRWTAVEAAAGVRRLVLLGSAGSGKSTFARYLALSLAGELLAVQEANLRLLNGLSDGAEAADPELLPWPHGALLPIFVELRKLVRSEAFLAPDDNDEADRLLAFIEATAPKPTDPAFGELLRQALLAERGGALLVLDGLDETPATEGDRQRLRKVIASFVGRYPHCRVLLTCRPYAYRKESSWRLDGEGFEETTLAPFDQGKRRAFVTGWYRQLALRGQVDPERADRRSERLLREIEATSYLEPLAELPLMLTMMADLHATSGGRLPGGRAGLYERSVELLLDRWNEARDLLDGESVSERLGMTTTQMRGALERLAYEVHRDRGSASAGTPAAGTPAEITDQELWKALDRERSPELTVDERRVMDYLHQRSGILLGESRELYRFPHRSYQEYLAACYLSRTEFPPLLIRQAAASPELWREVLLLAAGKVAEVPFAVWALLEGLVPEAPGPEVAADDPRFFAALAAGLAVRENALWQAVQPQDEPKLGRIRRWLERALELGALPPVERARGGRVLGLLGDRRRGVGLADDDMPDIDWVEIPGGTFLMGSSDEDKQALESEKPRREVDLPSFRISRYPVTNLQYRAFVEAGGYDDPDCWTEEGREWKGERQGPDDNISPNYLLANHPRVEVTAYEADAFCGWLSRKLGREVRLPTEAEWEKAARGPDGRLYPWGNTFDASLCNMAETGIGRPSAVGAFPGDVSPYGVLDLAGNVREWMASPWTEGYAEAESPAASGVARVVRGGSYWFKAHDSRSAFRIGGLPVWAVQFLGFRVVLPSAPSVAV